MRNPFSKDKHDAKFRVKQAVVNIMLSEPFFGVLVSRLAFSQVPADHPRIHTMATNGRWVKFNEKWTESIDDQKGVTFVIGHEIMHNVYEHGGIARVGNRNVTLWGWAPDYVINGEMIELNSTIFGTALPTINGVTTGLYDPKYSGMTSEQVYDLLKDELKNEHGIDVDESGSGQGGGLKVPGAGGGQGDTGDEDGDGDGSGEGSQQISREELEQLLREVYGSTLDDHAESQSGDSKDGDQEGDGKGNKLTRAEIQELQREIVGAVQQAHDNADMTQGKGAGNIPGNVRRFVRDLRKPQVNWKQYFMARTKGYIRNLHTYARPNRRQFGRGTFVLPGQEYDDEVEVVIAIDNSGSISQRNLNEFLSEVKGMLSQFSQISLKVFAFDDEVDSRNIFHFTRNNIADVEKVEFVGCGGTSFTSIFDYLKREREVPKILLVATDGYPYGSWGDPKYCETIWLICDDPEHRIEAPFGKTVWYDSTKK